METCNGYASSSRLVISNGAAKNKVEGDRVYWQ